MDAIVSNTLQHMKHVYPETKVSQKYVCKMVKSLLTDHTFEQYQKGLIDYDILEEFCGNILSRIAIVHCITMPYDGNAYFNAKASELYKRSQTASNMVKTYDEYMKWGKKTIFQCCLVVYDIINKDPSRLFPLFQYLTKLMPPRQKHHVKDLLRYFLPNHKDYKNFEIEFDDVYSYKKSWELWETTSFRKEIVPKIVKYVEQRTLTSASDKTTARKGITRYIHTLKLIESYVMDKYKDHPKNIDSLHWFFASCSRQMFIDAVVCIVNEYCVVQNDNVRSHKSNHHGTEFVSSLLGLLKNCLGDVVLEKDILLLTPKQILPLCVNKREQAIDGTRRHFHQSELMRLEEYLQEHASTKWQLALLIFKEVGLRVGALSRLMGSDFLTSQGEIKDNVTVVEKMCIKRTFPVSDNMKQLLARYFDDNMMVKTNPSYYIFSSNHLGRHIPHTPGYITKQLQKFCDACEIYGKHTHSHAFRHTLVNHLMANGNKIENVSKFIGHSSVATTEQYYWTDNIQNIIPQMNIPWLTNRNRIAYPEDMSDEDEDEDLSTEMLVNIILTYHSDSVISNEQKTQIQERIPNIGDIFKNLCDYSIASSSVDDL
jgi:integrase